ncbi:MAG: hypothetical protein ACRD6I_06200, partial [Candidatus Acidiferrales bacterium]
MSAATPAVKRAMAMARLYTGKHIWSATAKLPLSFSMHLGAACERNLILLEKLNGRLVFCVHAAPTTRTWVSTIQSGTFAAALHT